MGSAELVRSPPPALPPTDTFILQIPRHCRVFVDITSFCLLEFPSQPVRSGFPALTRSCRPQNEDHALVVIDGSRHGENKDREGFYEHSASYGTSNFILG